MQGFFTKKEIETSNDAGNRTLSCVSCGLMKTCKSPKMAPYGNFRKKIMNIGEAPSDLEDSKGVPFQGKIGRILQHAYKDLGVDLFEDCININAVSCYSGSVRSLENKEIDCCRKTILGYIEHYKPKLIVLLGYAAVYSLIGHRWKKDLGGIAKWRGWVIPDQDFQAWICPTFHPSYIERSQDGPEEIVWKQDLQQAFQKVDEPLLKYIEPKIEIIDDLTKLTVLQNATEFAFDYETTGLKPHASGHRIVCCAIADTENHAFVFIMPNKKSERKPFIDLLINPKIGKIAQNMKYEHTWTKVRLLVDVENWVWDTMLASHIYDNRPGITGLKFQAYVQLGIVDYASDVSNFLKPATSTSANDINRIDQLLAQPGGKIKLMKYCGLDAVYEYRLAMKQRHNLLPF